MEGHGKEAMKWLRVDLSHPCSATNKPHTTLCAKRQVPRPSRAAPGDCSMFSKKPAARGQRGYKRRT